MRLTVTIDRDEDGVWVVECPSIPGCVSQGNTKEEALANMRESIELCIEVRAEQGMAPMAFVTAKQQPKTRLDILLSGVTEENRHTEIDTGQPIGNEAW